MVANLDVKLDQIDRDLRLYVGNAFWNSARSQMLADFAKESFEQARIHNERLLGTDLRSKRWVDGVFDRDEYSVRPDGTIVYEFQIIADIIAFIEEQLEIHSPVGASRDTHSGLYKRTHTVFADGSEVALGPTIPAAREYTFVSVQPYARKIERGESTQAPHGVYEVTAHEASKRFGNVARIEYVDQVGVQLPREQYGGNARRPAIRVTV
jgi:hypothetical protein